MSCNEADFTIKQNGRLPGIRSVLRGPSVHLANSVEFHMKLVADGGPVTKTGSAVIEDQGTPDQITVRYDWGATDTDTIGLWNGEWWLTIGGKSMKIPNDEYLLIQVMDDAA